MTKALRREDCAALDAADPLAPFLARFRRPRDLLYFDGNSLGMLPWAASRRVVEKLGFREEGLRRRYLHIDGAWRDHLCYALTAEEARGGVLTRWSETLSAQRSGTAS